MNAIPNYYDILGVSKHATENEMKKQYRALSYKYHPDRNPLGADQMQKLNEAYETLKDPQKRQEYDRGSNPLESFMEQLFRKEKIDPLEELFKSDYHETTPDLDVKIELSFQEAYNGSQFPVTVKRYIQKNRTMRDYEHEKIYLDIPRGVDDGEILKVREKGNCNQGVYSDLKIYIKVLSSEWFERKGIDLIYRHTIGFKESICGFSYSIPHPNGSVLKLQSSRGNIIQNQSERVIKNKGFVRDKDCGDLIIRFKVNITERLTEEQVCALEQVFNASLSA